MKVFLIEYSLVYCNIERRICRPVIIISFPFVFLFVVIIISRFNKRQYINRQKSEQYPTPYQCRRRSHCSHLPSSLPKFAPKFNILVSHWSQEPRLWQSARTFEHYAWINIVNHCTNESWLRISKIILGIWSNRTASVSILPALFATFRKTISLTQ